MFYVDKWSVEPSIFFIEKISFSLKLFSGHFYGQSFIKTVRGPLIFKDYSRQSCIFKYFSSLCEPCMALADPNQYQSMADPNQRQFMADPNKHQSMADPNKHQSAVRFTCCWMMKDCCCHSCGSAPWWCCRSCCICCGESPCWAACISIDWTSLGTGLLGSLALRWFGLDLVLLLEPPVEDDGTNLLLTWDDPCPYPWKEENLTMKFIEWPLDMSSFGNRVDPDRLAS